VIFRQLFDAQSSTYTYLLADAATREGVLIDPVFEQHLRDAALLRELEVKLRYSLETHVHADHVTGAWLMREAAGSAIAVGKQSGAEGADVYLEHGDVLRVGALVLEVRTTPGHTNGCLTYVLGDHSMAFTGDALLIRGAGRTDFQQGDAERLFDSVREQIFSLPDACALYPAHDYEGRTSTTVGEEREHNPRLGEGVRKQDFVGYMNNLGLPHPKKLAEAVPANLQCGRPGEGAAVPRQPDWGPVFRTFAGVPEVGAEWVHAHLPELTIVDVREHAEVAVSELGKIEGSVLIPLATLRERTSEVPRDRPVIAVCPAGARSAQAALILEQAGVPRVANLHGGLLRWRAQGYPTTPP
jgi:glyoxylase-like metal-dependent hydrolase (beta-lactamase superfamily II)/rhodanese-related sulfurtransferase